MRRRGPVAALGGALLGVSLFVPWYRPSPFIITRGSGGTVSESLFSTATFDAWESFTVIDVVLALVAALAILSLAVQWRGQTVAALLGVVLVACCLLDPPLAGVTLRPGAWLGLAGALLALAGTAPLGSGSNPPAGRRGFAPVPAIGGVVVLVSLFLTWYDVADEELDRTYPLPGVVARLDAAATGWQWFAITDILLAVAGVLALCTAFSRRPAVALAATAWCGLLAPWVLYRVLEQPGPLYVDGFGLAMEPRIGAWLGLAGALIAATGTWMALRDARRPAAAA